MKIKKSRVCISLLLFIFLFTVSGIISQSLTPQYKLETPKTSDDEITIVTPENRTYTEPDNGYYPAFYGFENELDGTSRTNIAYVDGTNAIQSNCEVEIINNYQGHNKVLRIHDGNTVGNAAAEHYFDSTQTTGTIEWWWLIPAVSNNRMWIHFHQDQMSTIAFSLVAVDDEFLQNNGAAVQTYNFNQWYHHKVSFDTNSDTYDWYIDGNMVVNGGAFETLVSNVGSTNIKGAWQTTGESYFDAFGYSWDPNYNVGDNVNEGLLLSYENTSSLDWRGYSLDGNANKTILGNTTIPMPSDGQHGIQIFGNDSLGTIYQSFIKYFSISPINIISPENKTYFEPMSGYYPATYGFENDVVNTIPDKWTDESVSGSCSISIQDQKDNHEKVVFISDADTGVGTGADATAQYNFKSTQVAGTIEFWVYKESGDCALVFQGNNDTTTGFIISIDTDNNGIFRYSPAPSTYVEFASGKYSDQKWFHIRIDFDCVTDTTDIYVNGIKEVDGGLFHLPVPDISFIQIRSGYSGRSGMIYFDALGLSWDPNYDIGDNMNEGLLLSYENSTSLDWQGYSLDGNANKTILGNATIPMPNFGIHAIKIFGNNSLGTMYQSDMRYFTVTPINIISPESKTYTKPMRGYYPALYGFENELEGTSGATIEYADDASISSSCEVKIYDEFQGHKKVLRIHDGNTNGNAGAEHYFPSTQTTGSVEWCWITPVSGSNTIAYHFHEGIIGTHVGLVEMKDGNFKDMEGNIIQSYVANQWYHNKVVFDTTSDTYDWYIDGILRVDDGNFLTPVNNIGSTHIKGGWTSTGSCYVDAIGLSWDPNYNVGDNVNEGLLLSYENSTSLDWQGYSLDGTVNKTILGNTTIPMPSNGLHSIQVFGNDSIGTMYESAVQHFSVDTTSFINIITPENTGYFEPMSGYYLGTTGFEDTENGLLPSNMDDLPSDSNCQAIVVSEKADHNKVVHIDDNSIFGRVRLNYNFTDLDYGFLEFWVCARDATSGLIMQLWDDDGATNPFQFTINDDKWGYYISSTWYVIPAFDGIYDPQDNTWYHITVHFRGNGSPTYQGLNENQYKLIIDGRDSGGINFDNPGASIERLRFFTSGALTSDFWVDAFGVSCDPDYNLEDNLNEGLLLSFNYSDNFNWIGYSLDGNPNITITGNKVILVPEIGIHSIILNGITSEGMVIQSELRLFTIFIQDPPIPDYPDLIPIFLTSIVLGIIALLGITLLLIRRKMFSRTSSIIISPAESRIVENIDFRRDQINFCPFCGAQAMKTYQFCENCGASFKDI